MNPIEQIKSVNRIFGVLEQDATNESGCFEIDNIEVANVILENYAGYYKDSALVKDIKCDILHAVENYGDMENRERFLNNFECIIDEITMNLFKELGV